MLYIAKNIKALRAEKKLSQAHLASQLGIVPGTISNYENGVSTPDFEMLEKLTKILEVSAHDLLYEDLSSENLKTKTPKNATVQNGGEKGGKKGGIPKLQKTPPFEVRESDILPEGEENMFSGMTQKEVRKELRMLMYDYLMDMYDNGRAYPAAVVREYQAKIEALTTQVARLEYKNEELSSDLAAFRGKTGASKGSKAAGKGVIEEK